MGTQKAIAEQIVDGEADYVLALKGNQGDAASGASSTTSMNRSKNDFADVNARRHVHTKEKGHGREETRSYIQMPAPEDLPGFATVEGI